MRGYGCGGPGVAKGKVVVEKVGEEFGGWNRTVVEGIRVREVVMEEGDDMGGEEGEGVGEGEGAGRVGRGGEAVGERGGGEVGF